MFDPINAFKADLDRNRSHGGPPTSDARHQKWLQQRRFERESMLGLRDMYRELQATQQRTARELEAHKLYAKRLEDRISQYSISNARLKRNARHNDEISEPPTPDVAVTSVDAERSQHVPRPAAADGEQHPTDTRTDEAREAEPSGQQPRDSTASVDGGGLVPPGEAQGDS